MSKNIKVAFDLGNSSLKIAAMKKSVLELHELPLPENLVEEDEILMPHAFSAFLKRPKRTCACPVGRRGCCCPPARPSAGW